MSSIDFENKVIDLIRFYEQARGGNTSDLRQVYKITDLEELEEVLQNIII